MKSNIVFFSVAIVASILLVSCSGSKTTDVLTEILAADTGLGIWTAKSPLPISGSGRTRAVAFSIGNYGYAGLGAQASGNAFRVLNDFWKYDPSNDTWTETSSLDIKGGSRMGAFSFQIGDMAYVGGGFSDSAGSKSLLQDFYAYDPASDTWTRKADLPSAIVYATAFSLNGKGFAGTGGGGGVDASGNVTSGSLKTFYQYDPSLDKWQTIKDYPGTSRLGAMSFVYNNVAYVVGGRTITTIATENKDTYPTDFYSFDGTTWKKLKPIDHNIARQMGVALTLNGKAYITGGDSLGYSGQNTTWAYDIYNDSWRQVASYVGTEATFGMIGFSINRKGYIGGGEPYANPVQTSSAFYEFLPDSTK